MCAVLGILFLVTPQFATSQFMAQNSPVDSHGYLQGALYDDLGNCVRFCYGPTWYWDTMIRLMRVIGGVLTGLVALVIFAETWGWRIARNKL